MAHQWWWATIQHVLCQPRPSPAVTKAGTRRKQISGATVESAKEYCVVVVVVVADCESFVAINDSVILVGHTFPVFIIKFCLFVACPCFSCAIPIQSTAPGILIKETPPAEIFTLAPGLRINTTHVPRLPSPSVSCCCCCLHPLTKHVLCVLLSPSSLVEGEWGHCLLYLPVFDQYYRKHKLPFSPHPPQIEFLLFHLIRAKRMISFRKGATRAFSFGSRRQGRSDVKRVNVRETQVYRRNTAQRTKSTFRTSSLPGLNVFFYHLLLSSYWQSELMVLVYSWKEDVVWMFKSVERMNEQTLSL